MKVAFLYAGQGSQHPGMGQDLYEAYPAFRAVLDSAEVGFDLKADDMQQALYLFDGQLGTSYRNEGTITFGVKPGVEAYALLMNSRKDGKPLSVTVKQLAADGSTLAEVTATEPFCKVALQPGVASVQLTGDAEIFEIVPTRK